MVLYISHIFQSNQARSQPRGSNNITGPWSLNLQLSRGPFGCLWVSLMSNTLYAFAEVVTYKLSVDYFSEYTLHTSSLTVALESQLCILDSLPPTSVPSICDEFNLNYQFRWIWDYCNIRPMGDRWDNLGTWAASLDAPWTASLQLS